MAAPVPSHLSTAEAHDARLPWKDIRPHLRCKSRRCGLLLSCLVTETVLTMQVVKSAEACLRPDGIFCAFSPCIEQVQRTCEALASCSFTTPRTMECLLRSYEVCPDHLPCPACSQSQSQDVSQRSSDDAGDVQDAAPRKLVMTCIGSSDGIPSHQAAHCESDKPCVKLSCALHVCRSLANAPDIDTHFSPLMQLHKEGTDYQQVQQLGMKGRL